jgi:hypothetical protein
VPDLRELARHVLATCGGRVLKLNMKKTAIRLIALVGMTGAASAQITHDLQNARDLRQHVRNLEVQVTLLRAENEEHQREEERQREQEEEKHDLSPDAFLAYFTPTAANPLSASDRFLERQMQADPIAYGRPDEFQQHLEPVEMPSLPGISPEVAGAIPMPVPPRPIKYMPMEEQLLWNKIQAEALERQVSLQERINRLKR